MDKKNSGQVTSIPVFTCRPNEFKLLRDSITDGHTYSTSYTEYLKTTSSFIRDMIMQPDHSILRGTWDVAHYLKWCKENKRKPRKQSRLDYFRELARLHVNRTPYVVNPDISTFVDFNGSSILRYCCSSKCNKKESSPDSFMQCTRCKCNVYCSADCQRGDWKGHKKWCAAITK